MKKHDIDAASLVSIIYEKVQTPHLYQGLTPSDDLNLAGFDITDQELNSFSPGMLNPDLLNEIAPHLKQAVGLIEKQQGAEAAQRGASTLSLFDLPLPICLFSRKSELLQINGHAEGMLTAGIQLPHNASRALSIEQPLKQDILTAVALTLDTNTPRTVSFNGEPGVVRTALVIPQNPSKQNTAEQAAVLFLNHESRIDELAMALIRSHGLTQSEAEVAAYLAQGFAPEEIANKKNISINTVRTQMKHVYKKTGTSRQAQLVSLVLSGPAIWMNILNNKIEAGQNSSTRVDTPADVITLSDGRKLSYGDFGPRDGVPVILFHHLFGSRNDKPEDETVLDRLGIRLVIPERPGVGLTSRAPNMTILNWGEDVVELIDQLELDRVHVAGLSSGATYAAGFATVLGDRAINLGLIAGQMPVDELPKGVRIGTVHRFVTSISRFLPSMAHKLLESNYDKLLADPAEMLSQYKRKTNPADKRLHLDPHINSIRLQNIQEASTRRRSVYAQELVRGFRHWGFRLSELNLPVILWHGKQDELFSFEHVEKMADIIPNCETVFSDHWGHFFPLTEWESIYEILIKPSHSQKSKHTA